MNSTILETIHTLQERATHLEQEAGLLRQELAQMAQLFLKPTSVVARYVVDGEIYEITQADVESVRAGLVRSWPETSLYELAAAKKVAKRLRERSPEARNEHFFQTVEAIRAAAVADGTAIETEEEATIDD